MSEQLCVQLLDHNTIDDQVDVYRQIYDLDETFEETKNKWFLKHYTNPFADSYIFGVYDNHKLVSINAYMPLKYSFNCKELNVLESCESCTLPSYRGKGIWSKVVRFAIDYFVKENKYDFLMGFPNVTNSFGGFMKMNWSHDADVINYILVCNGNAFCKCVLGKDFGLMTKPLEFLHLNIDVFCKKYKCVATDTVESATKEGFSISTNDEFMRWKKQYRKLKTFSLFDENDICVASCSYFIELFNGEQVAFLCSISNESCKSDKTIYASCIKEIMKKNHDIAFIRLWITKGSDELGCYKKLGFLKSKHKNPFITFMLNNNNIENHQLNLEANWKNLSFLDLD